MVRGGMMLAAAWAMPGAAELDVVHEAPGAVAAAGYVDVAVVDEAAGERALRSARRQLSGMVPQVDAPSAFPVVPASLVRGRGAVRSEDREYSIFVVGWRDGAWLKRMAGRLREAQAIGYVVAAPRRQDFEVLRRIAEAEGLVLVVMPGEGAAEVFGVREYPVFVEGRR